jgi:hypothetical protein
VTEVFVKDVIAQSNFGDAYQAPQESVVRKFVGKGECAGFDLPFDHFEALPSATQIGFGWWALYRGSIADAVQSKVELNSASRRGDHAASEPLAAHRIDLVDTENRIIGQRLLDNDGARAQSLAALVRSGS